MLDGRMMDFPLTLTHFLERARQLFPRTEVVSRRPDKSLHRHGWAEVHARASQLCNALTKLGVKRGSRVATLCWNHTQHLEAYLGVPAMGAIVHTLNLRLHPSELAYIGRHAEDEVVIVDRTLLPLLAKFRNEIPSLRHVIVVPDDGPATPEQGHDYEKLIAAERPEYAFPTLDERAAAMICYTSGTTGNPKGVVYTHRSCVLHTMAACMRDSLGVGEDDTILPVVPMFHAAAWGLPFAAAACGAKLVFPGPHLDAASLVELMAAEKVTVAAGVPTIWLGILALLDAAPKTHDLSSVRSMVIGGSAAPAAMIDGFAKRHGLEVTHAWGMTETNPLGTLSRLTRSFVGQSDEKKLAAKASQGITVPFVEARHVGDDGKPLARDGETMGELEVRGPWVASSYLGGEGAEKWTADGWFRTGDVVTIDKEGYVRITDRSKDVIKSGGEWISSVAIENALMAHPAVIEAAVFAGRHPKWDERPLAAIVCKAGQTVTADQLRAHLEPIFAKFWMPDDFLFVEQIPRTSTGKFLKSKLRDQFGDHLMPK
ncbi:MAG: long-chain fatty acid--CoA ligase [Myxococcales bacterium]|nr:long-chain fatty acid--CoA ligase [Myxococcales bacterium]